jgi:transcriptional regulator GlxA family with amidase domain
MSQSSVCLFFMKGISDLNIYIHKTYSPPSSFHLLDFTGPLSVLNAARHNPKDSASEAFDCTFAAGKQNVMSSQGVVVQSHISWKEAKDNIDEYVVNSHHSGTQELTPPQ